MNFFRKLFKSTRQSSKTETYRAPIHKCSSLILLSGPSYGDRTFFGSFLLDAVAVKEWVLDHSKSIWTNSKSEQLAREFLPHWLEHVTYADDDCVTLLDEKMRLVLVPYTYDFYDKGWVSIYCHQCKAIHDTILDNTHNVERVGNTSSWTEEWLCSAGHIVHHKEHEVRWIVKKSRSL